MNKILLFILMVMPFMVRANHWETDPYQYPNNMTVVGVISFDGEEQRSEYLEIGAFCDDECRGSATAMYEEMLDRYYVFMMIYGNNNDSIVFRCYDHSIGTEVDMIQETAAEFHSNDMLGGVAEPFIFSFKSYQYNISIDVLPESGGSVIGDGVYKKYDTCYVEMNPNVAYRFNALYENDVVLTTDEQYSFVVLNDCHLVAEFSLLEYEVSLSVSPEEGGTVFGDGLYSHGSMVEIVAIPNEDYVFLGWTKEDGTLFSDDSNYIFEITEDISLRANFEFVDAVSDNINADVAIYPNPATAFIIVRNDGCSWKYVSIIDMYGKVVIRQNLDCVENKIDVSDLAEGTYVIIFDGKSKPSKIIINNQ